MFGALSKLVQDASKNLALVKEMIVFFKEILLGLKWSCCKK